MKSLGSILQLKQRLNTMQGITGTGHVNGMEPFTWGYNRPIEPSLFGDPTEA